MKHNQINFELYWHQVTSGKETVFIYYQDTVQKTTENIVQNVNLETVA